MSYLATAFRDCAAHAAAALGAAGLGLVLLLIAAVSGNRAAARGYLVSLTAGTVSFAVAIAAAIVTVWTGRLDLVGATMPDQSKHDLTVIFRDIQLQVLGISLVGAVTLLFFIAGALLILTTRRDPAGQSRRQQLCLVAVWLLPLLPAAAGALAYGLRLGNDLAALSFTPASTKTMILFRSMQESRGVLDGARVGLGVTVALALAFATFRSKHGGALMTASRAKTVGSRILFASGLAVFLLTRGHAADRAPLPLLAGGSMDASRASKLPQLSRCRAPTRPGPVLTFDRDEVTLDRSPVDPLEFQERIETMRSSYPLLHQGRTPPVLAIVLATPATPLARMIPYLQRVGVGEVDVATAVRSDFQSRTLGQIERYQYCGQPFRLTPDGKAISDHGSWSKLSAAVAESETLLELAAR
jgi:hypothetical protein